jgi:shikimate kinase
MGNIVLVGFMGTGKTVVGKLLAARLNRQRLCLDDMIERKTGKTIASIFEQDGEAFFRKVEKDMVRTASSNRDAVIDAGGGAIIDEENIRRFKGCGIIICLKARPDIIYERTKGHIHRPLLNRPDPVKNIKKMLDQRQRYYSRADYTIDTSDLSPEGVVEKIVDIAERKDSHG